MATLRDIKRRISSIAKTQQITRAMQMVAASRLKKAQETAISWRPYHQRMTEVFDRLLTRTATDAHPLLAVREPRTLELFVITSDKGLCGGFNLAMCQKVEQFIASNRNNFEEISLTIVGKKGRDYFKRRPLKLREELGDIPRDPANEWVSAVTRDLSERYREGTFDTGYLCYHGFKSVLQQVVVMDKLFPFKEAGAETLPIDYLFEPDRQAVLETVIPRYLETRVATALYESTTSEYAARMSAMDQASKNARDMIEILTLNYNKVRQEMITKELMDIVGGAEALQ
jgi:F-type H+-transporting ATPase subunit gamma